MKQIYINIQINKRHHKNKVFFLVDLKQVIFWKSTNLVKHSRPSTKGEWCQDKNNKEQGSGVERRKAVNGEGESDIVQDNRLRNIN